MQTPEMPLKLDQEMTSRVERLAAQRHESPETLIHEALTQYLEREENPLEKKYPQRTPVGGIITPV
jgi:predicted transcriptional regulator